MRSSFKSSHSKNRFALSVINQTFRKEKTIIAAKFWQGALNTNLYGSQALLLNMEFILFNLMPVHLEDLNMHFRIFSI